MQAFAERHEGSAAAASIVKPSLACTWLQKSCFNQSGQGLEILRAGETHACRHQQVVLLLAEPNVAYTDKGHGPMSDWRAPRY